MASRYPFSILLAAGLLCTALLLSAADASVQAASPVQEQAQVLKAQVDDLTQVLLQLHNASDDVTRKRLMQDYWTMLQKQLQYLRHLPGVETHDCKDWTMLDPGVVGRVSVGSNIPCPLMGHDAGPAAGWPLPEGMTPKLFEFMMDQQLKLLRAQTADAAVEPDPTRRLGLIRQLYETRFRDIQTVRGRDWMWTPHDIASLPDGHSLGAELLGRYCSQCHAAPLPNLYTQAEWQGITYYMRDVIQSHKGEQVMGLQMPTPTEFDLITGYLEAHAHAARDSSESMGVGHQGNTTGWVSISEETNCEAMRNDYCLGAFGFRIHMNGAYETGYRPSTTSHTTKSGQLAPDDLDALRHAITDAASRESSWETTDADRHMPGISDNVTLAFSDGHEQLVPATESGLRDLIKTLMKKYYPVPYPPS